MILDSGWIIMEWILFIVVFLFILGFVMRDQDPKDSGVHRENPSKVDDYVWPRRHDDLDPSNYIEASNAFHHTHHH